MADWQPMDTAPEGDHCVVIDMWAQGRRITDCSWGKPTYGDGVYGWVHCDGRDCDGPVYERVVNPTHWQPLPDPPK